VNINFNEIFLLKTNATNHREGAARGRGIRIVGENGKKDIFYCIDYRLRQKYN